MEIWRDVKDLPRYKVSNYGRVMNSSERILKGSINNHGYVRYDLCLDGKRVVRSGHRLVAEAFIPREKGKDSVNHKDGDKTNNYVGNLEWCTTQENTRHAFRELGVEVSNKRSVRCIETGIEYSSAMEAERITGIPNACINRCCRKKRRSAHGFKWEYANNDAVVTQLGA